MLIQDNKYRLRWKFIYFDGKPDRFGEWDRSSSKETMACYAPKENLAWAMIEGKDVHNEITPLITIQGHMFVNFEWIGAIICPDLTLLHDKITIVPKNIGARLITPEYVYTIYKSGKQTKNLRTLEDKAYNFFGNK